MSKEPEPPSARVDRSHDTELDRWGGITAEDFSKIADKVYERLLSEHVRVSGVQLDMAKWMIASLLLINGAALVACMQSTRISFDAVIFAGIAFSIGVISAILAGLGTWIHSSHVKGILRERIESHFLVDPNRFPPRNARKERRARHVSSVSAAVGLLSLICFALGCVAIATQATNTTAKQSTNNPQAAVHHPSVTEESGSGSADRGSAAPDRASPLERTEPTHP